MGVLENGNKSYWNPVDLWPSSIFCVQDWFTKVLQLFGHAVQLILRLRFVHIVDKSSNGQDFGCFPDISQVVVPHCMEIEYEHTQPQDLKRVNEVNKRYLKTNYKILI